MTEHTKGPWAAEDADEFGDHNIIPANGQALAIAAVVSNLRPKAEVAANARLVASAPDHALLGWAMCIGAGRWEAWGDGRGEFCINGLRHSTKLDEFGCPKMTDGMRDAIRKAKG